MQKLVKTKIIYFILGVVVSVGITSVFAFDLIASSVGFTPTDNEWRVDDAQEAIDDLYWRINRPTDAIATGDQTFSSGSTSLFKMNITVLNTDYLSNSGNVLTVKKPGKYLIVSVVGSNASPNGGCSYTGYMRLFINNVQTIAFQHHCGYSIYPYIADFNVNDQFYLGLYGDGANYSKRASVYVYKL